VTEDRDPTETVEVLEDDDDPVPPDTDPVPEGDPA
jgi:hypothetical protein